MAFGFLTWKLAVLHFRKDAFAAPSASMSVQQPFESDRVADAPVPTEATTVMCFLHGVSSARSGPASLIEATPASLTAGADASSKVGLPMGTVADGLGPAASNESSAPPSWELHPSKFVNSTVSAARSRGVLILR